jgi:LPXTG-motif cell wall-anchored protein
MRPGKSAIVALAVLVFVSLLPTLSQADQWDRKTVMTFSQAVEIPGKILPAGTYTFKTNNIPSSRNIVQIFNQDETQLIATILAIPNYRLTSTGETVVKFAERPSRSPQALKAWFYPGEYFGHEFAYPKERALELARAEHEAVPALTEEPTLETMQTVPMIAITPELKEAPVEHAIQTTPPPAQQPAPMVAQRQELPHTASSNPMIALLGFILIALAFGLKAVSRTAGRKA